MLDRMTHMGNEKRISRTFISINEKKSHRFYLSLMGIRSLMLTIETTVLDLQKNLNLKNKLMS